MPCNLHFDDSTAHATVKWFLAQLSEESSIIDKTLSSYDSNHANAEDRRKDLENLCKDLNAVRFIDCLREQVKKKNDDLFKRILGIAKRLNKGEKWKNFPNLIALLFSIVQKRPDECVKNSCLYKIAKKIYEHYKNFNERHDSPESRALIFRVGLQLSRFQNESWQRKFSAFKTLYDEELSKLRWKYYSVDNPAEYSRRVIVRWKGEYEKPEDDESNSEYKEYKELSEEFSGPDPSFPVMDPMFLELPIQERSTEALRIADVFVRDLRDKKKNNTGVAANFNIELANKFRIVQWDVLVRNLVEESLEKTLCFHPITDELDISGSLDLDGFLLEFIRKAREVGKHFTSYDGEIPKKRGDDYNLLAEDSYFHEDEVENCHKSFEKLLPKVPDYHPCVYEDLVQSFSETRNSDESTNTILIEDGELSFFSLLWLLRYAMSVEGWNPINGWKPKPNDGKPKPNEEHLLPIRFRPSEGDSSDAWWSQCNMYDFAEELGLIIRLNSKNCVLTRRWRSLVVWLRRLNDYFQRANAKEQKLPVKVLDYDKKEESFVDGLKSFFASDALKEKLDGELNIFSSNVFSSCETFAKKFKVLIKLLEPLIKGTSSGGLEDKVLLRCCRAGFIPLEHLFRAYQPYELHLLIQALNWEESTVTGWTQAPISLGFATIAGQVESSPDTTINSGSSRDVRKDFRHWLGPYRSFFSALSANIALPAVQRDSEQIGKQTGTAKERRTFAHQTSSLIGTLWLDPKTRDLSSQSQFSLWLVKTQTVEIWGNIPIDVKKEIYNEDFLNWQEKDAREIVNKLCDLGLRGGVARAAEPPKVKKSIFDPEWQAENEVTNYAAKELEPSLRDPNEVIKAKETIEKVRSLLIPETDKLVPETEPPSWVTTSAFTMCFYHGLRQSAYHALRRFVYNKKQKGQRYLWIDWDEKSVSIYNQGVKKSHSPSSGTTDSEFFRIFQEKAEVFEIDGPEPLDEDELRRLRSSLQSRFKVDRSEPLEATLDSNEDFQFWKLVIRRLS